MKEKPEARIINPKSQAKAVMNYIRREQLHWHQGDVDSDPIQTKIRQVLSWMIDTGNFSISAIEALPSQYGDWMRRVLQGGAIRKSKGSTQIQPASGFVHLKFLHPCVYVANVSIEQDIRPEYKELWYNVKERKTAKAGDEIEVDFARAACILRKLNYDVQQRNRHIEVWMDGVGKRATENYVVETGGLIDINVVDDEGRLVKKHHEW